MRSADMDRISVVLVEVNTPVDESRLSPSGSAGIIQRGWLTIGRGIPYFDDPWSHAFRYTPSVV